MRKTTIQMKFTLQKTTIEQYILAIQQQLYQMFSRLGGQCERFSVHHQMDCNPWRLSDQSLDGKSKCKELEENITKLFILQS